MMFLLTTLKIAYMLDPNLPTLFKKKDDKDPSQLEIQKKRQNDQLLWRAHINCLSDRLHNLLTSIESPVNI